MENISIENASASSLPVKCKPKQRNKKSHEDSSQETIGIIDHPKVVHSIAYWCCVFSSEWFLKCKNNSKVIIKAI